MQGRRGFTLIELLVVVSIIVLLIAMLMPALANSRESGRTAACMGNLRALGTGVLGLAMDHDKRLPGI